MREAETPTQRANGKRLARRVGERAGPMRFMLWGGFLGVLTLAMVWIALVSVEDQSYSVRVEQPASSAGDVSRHAYAYQGLARMLRAEGLGGQTVSGNSPLGSVGLRILLEPQLSSSDQDARRAFRRVLSQSRTPVLLVSSVRDYGLRLPRLDGQKHLVAPIEKLTGPASVKRLNAPLGLSQSASQHTGLSAGQVMGFEVVVEDLVYFRNLSDSAQIRSVQGRDFLFRQWVGGTAVYILSDPDILNNAGLNQGENAQFVRALIEEIKKPGAVVFDNRDVRVGSTTSFSFIGRLFDWPLVIVSGSVLTLVALLFWIAFGRFGPMLRDPVFLAAGKETALEAAVTMLTGTGNNREILRRYLDGQTRQITAQLGGPKTGDLARMRSWLDAVAKRRKIDPTLRLVPLADRLQYSASELNENQAASTAHAIHAFRKAMLHHVP